MLRIIISVWVYIENLPLQTSTSIFCFHVEVLEFLNRFSVGKNKYKEILGY